MRRIVLVLAVVAACSLMVRVAAQQDSPATSRQDQKEKDTEKKEKNKKNKPEDAVFSQAVASSLLNDLRDGLTGHSQRLMLSAFDPDKMEGYLSFEYQIEALFQHYDSFRVHYRITQTTVEGARGVVLAEFEMEGIPLSGATPQRRQGQLKFEMQRGRKGWKIVDFTPRGFFS